MNANVTIIRPIGMTSSARKTQVAAYCRVSSDSNDQLNSLQAQLKNYESFLSESETEELVDVYADEGITGTRMDKRDELQRLLRDCRKGKIDRIVTKSISRFARNTKECLTMVRELRALGVSILFEKENIDTAKISDEMMITIMGALAQEESISISKNVKWNYRKQMQDGTINFHSAPYGYDLLDGKLVVNDSEAWVVREIFDMFLSGSGYLEISKELNKRGITKSKGSPKWLAPAIQYILGNEKYIGDSLWQKSYNLDNPFRKVRNKGDCEQWYLTNTHEPIISEQQFEMAQELIAKSKKPNKDKIQSYPFSKIIQCGVCGSSFRRKTDKAKVYWGCRGHYYDKTACPINQIHEAEIEQAFIRLHNKLLANYKQILLPLRTSLQELKLKRYSGNEKLLTLHKEIAKLREQCHVIARLKTKGFLDEAKYAEQSASLNAKISKAQADLKRFSMADDEDETLEQIDLLIDCFEKRSDMMTMFEEAAFAELVEKIVVKENELVFHMAGGFKLTEKI